MKPRQDDRRKHSPEIREAWKFFHEHAGHADPPGRAACALELAKAEKLAKARGYEIRWQDDPEPWDGDADMPVPEKVETAFLVNDEGEVLESLSSIGDADDNYRRVVGAELALQALQKPPIGNYRHRQNGGGNCPVCNFCHIEGDSGDFDGGTYTQRVSCLRCDAVWYDEYILIGYSELSYTTMEDVR